MSPVPRSNRLVFVAAKPAPPPVAAEPVPVLVAAEAPTPRVDAPLAPFATTVRVAASDAAGVQ